LRTLRRCSQRSRLRWDKFNERLASLLPPVQVLHPYPNVRFAAKHPNIQGKTVCVSSARTGLCWGSATAVPSATSLDNRVETGGLFNLPDSSENPAISDLRNRRCRRSARAALRGVNLQQLFDALFDNVFLQRIGISHARCLVVNAAAAVNQNKLRHHRAVSETHEGHHLFNRNPADRKIYLILFRKVLDLKIGVEVDSHV